MGMHAGDSVSKRVIGSLFCVEVRVVLHMTEEMPSHSV